MGRVKVQQTQDKAVFIEARLNASWIRSQCRGIFILGADALYV